MADITPESKQLIRVFTLNCWGIPFISKDKKNRIEAIAEYLATCNLDLVCLQEVWAKKDYLYISKKCHFQLPYSHYFNSFINGSGLCILSKYPITEVYFHQWAINGYAHKIHQGDWFAGKGLAFARIQINNLIVHLYNAHLHAEYNIHNAEYLSHRVLQAFDTSQFIKLTSEDCDLAILAGDLNTEPDDLAMKILCQNAHLMDSYVTAQKKSTSNYGTSESTRNSYAPESELKRLPEGKRIDYILYRNSKKLTVKVLNYQFPLSERVPGHNYSYSDHEGIEVVLLCMNSTNPDVKAPEVMTQDLQLTLKTAVEICNDTLNKLLISQRTYLTLSVIFAFLIFISLFAELFFGIPLDFSVDHVASIICFNLVKSAERRRKYETDKRTLQPKLISAWFIPNKVEDIAKTNRIFLGCCVTVFFFLVVTPIIMVKMSYFRNNTIKYFGCCIWMENTFLHYLKNYKKTRVEKTAHHLQELFIEIDDPLLKEEIEIFSLQLMHKKPEFNVCGFFKLDFSLLHSMIATVAIYIIILKQV